MREYIGIPFKAGGRERNGADCWGLVRMFLFEQHGIELPSLTDDYDSIADSGRIASLIVETATGVNARKVEDPRAGDIAVMRFRGAPVHVGVLVDNDHILHTLHGTASAIERRGSPRICSRIEGYYRVG